jgi:integrase
MTIDECKRFLNACDFTFYPLAMAGLQSGMRYGELGRLKVSDFDKNSGTLIVLKSKTAKPRHVFLTPTGVQFFSDATAGRSPSELMFTKADGGRWTHGAQGKYIARACESGRIDPAISFHMLRHTYCSLCAMSGVPLTVIAKNVGASVKLIESTYGHLSPSYVGDMIRTGAPRFV